MKLWIAAATAALVLAGCQKKNEEKAAPPPPPFAMDISTKNLMGHAIDPAADIVWAASGYIVDEHGTTDLSPKTREGWETVEANATIVAELSNALLMPGRAVDEPQWTAAVKQLRIAAMGAVKAARDHDKDGIFRTGGDMHLACIACHKRYVIGDK